MMRVQLHGLLEVESCLEERFMITEECYTALLTAWPGSVRAMKHEFAQCTAPHADEPLMTPGPMQWRTRTARWGAAS